MSVRDVQKEFETATGRDWMTNPVCHGELGFASWEYQTWLESQVLRLRPVPATKELESITDEDAIACARIAKIDSDFVIERTAGRDKGCIQINGKSGKGNRSLRIYFNGSNTKVEHDDYTVIEYCFDVYDYLRSLGYNIHPNRK